MFRKKAIRALADEEIKIFFRWHLEYLFALSGNFLFFRRAEANRTGPDRLHVQINYRILRRSHLNVKAKANIYIRIQAWEEKIKINFIDQN